MTAAKQTKPKKIKSKEKRSSLIRTLLLCIVLTIIIINIAQLLFITKDTRASIIQDKTSEYILLSDSYAQSIRNNLDSYLNELNSYIDADIMKDRNLPEIFEWLIAHEKMRSKHFDYIMIAGANGTAHTDLGTTVGVSQRAYYQNVYRGKVERFVNTPLMSKTTGQPVVHLTRPIKDKNGEIYAMIGGVVNCKLLTEEVNNMKIGKNGYAWLISDDGMVFAHKNADYIMKRNFITDTDKNGPNADLIDVAIEIAGGKSGTAWINADGRKGKDLVIYRPIPDTKWGFAISIPDIDLYELVDRIGLHMIMFSVISIVILSAVAGILLIQMMKPLTVVEKAITDIASGDADLTRRIDINSNNEIGFVVKGFNAFAQKLQDIIGDVKSSKEELNIAGSNLSNATHDTASSITQIIANIDSMHRQIEGQNASVNQTAGAVTQIASNIESLGRMVESQSSGVTQASAAVEEMIGNISSVNTSVDKMANSFSDLRSNSQVGIDKQKAVNDRISQIEAQSKMLQEANVAISSIASQTNLLAMNAAIEAAHAGEAGKGFAVVADEIRKLSETSTAQSKTIGVQLNNIKESIGEVVSASSEASLAFETVSRKLEETDNLVMQIKSAMEEQNEGSKQITEALHSMQDSTLEVKNASNEMEEGNKMILKEVQTLQDAANTMSQSMEEMAIGAKKINETGTALSEVSDHINASIDKIGEQVDKFKV
ncbi:MAG: HAMP domain-containing protein [Treponema sp.]|nr:HAMP domain-containing protein [Treponema sp.]